MTVRHTEPMKNFTITISVPDDLPDEPEAIFDDIQMMLADLHPGSEASFGSGDDLVHGDDLVARIAPRDLDLTAEQSKRLLHAIITGKGTYEEGKEFPYSIRISFVADRELTDHELDVLATAATIQIEDPYVPDAEGELVRADFTVRDVTARVDK